MQRSIPLTLWLVAASVLGGCGEPGPASSLHAGLHAASAELTVADAVTADGGFASGRVEVLVSRTRLRIIVEDARLAAADSAARAAAAARAVATAEKALASDPEFPAIDSISVALVHPAGLRPVLRGSHTEEVFDFRRVAGAGFEAAG